MSHTGRSPLHVSGGEGPFAPRARLHPGQQWPIANEAQRRVLVGILAECPNDVRLAVAAAYLKVQVQDIYTAIGLTLKIRHGYSRTDSNGNTPFSDGPAWFWVARVARCLGIAPGEMWQLDEDFDPVECLPMKIDSHGRLWVENNRRDFFDR